MKRRISFLLAVMMCVSLLFSSALPIVMATDKSVELESFKKELIESGRIEQDSLEKLMNKLVAIGVTEPADQEKYIDAVICAREAKEEILQAMIEQGLDPSYYAPLLSEADAQTEVENYEEVKDNSVDAEQIKLEEYINATIAAGRIKQDSLEKLMNKLVTIGVTEPADQEKYIDAVICAREAKEEILQAMIEQGLDPSYYAPLMPKADAQTEVENYEVVKDNSVEAEQIKLEEYINATIAAGRIKQDSLEKLMNKLVAIGVTEPADQEKYIDAVISAREAKEEILQAMIEQGLDPSYYAPLMAEAAEQAEEDEAADINVPITDLPDPVIWQDVGEGVWYFDAVEYGHAEGLMNGVGDNCFAPQDVVSRAMAATVLYRLAGEQEAKGSNPFPDVEAGQWYTDAVIWAAGEKIIEGYGNGSFGTNDPVTREQLVTMFWRAEGKPDAEPDALSAFSDADQISAWAEEAFAWAVSTGLIQGKPGGILDPKGTITRAEVAQVLMNYDNLK